MTVARRREALRAAWSLWQHGLPAKACEALDAAGFTREEKDDFIRAAQRRMRASNPLAR